MGFDWKSNKSIKCNGYTNSLHFCCSFAVFNDAFLTFASTAFIISPGFSIITFEFIQITEKPSPLWISKQSFAKNLIKKLTSFTIGGRVGYMFSCCFFVITLKRKCSFTCYIMVLQRFL